MMPGEGRIAMNIIVFKFGQFAVISRGRCREERGTLAVETSEDA